MILFIDKPAGLSSFDVIRRLREKMGIRKMGHAGTLDPLATGLLIVATGDDTKQLNQYLQLPKTYEFSLEFGKTSDTYDADGAISEGVSRPVTRNEFEKVLAGFRGDISQTPPAFSAIKIGGVPAYEFARRGEKVDLKPRTVTVTELSIIDWNWPRVTLRVSCTKGFYVRSLAHDLGELLGCGAYVTALRRTHIGKFCVDDAQRLE